MIKPICERGKNCVFLEIKIESYEYPLFARSEKIVRGKQKNYYCDNPNRFNSWELPKKLTHENKFKMCKNKVTNKLDEFIK